MARRGGIVEGKVYVGGLPEDATSEELDDAFHKFGRIRKIWVARRPPGFAFVEFDDVRDAEDAVRALDGTRICGVKARVELSHGAGRGSGGGGRGFRGGGSVYNDRERSRERDRYRSYHSSINHHLLYCSPSTTTSITTPTTTISTHPPTQNNLNHYLNHPLFLFINVLPFPSTLPTTFIF